MKIKTEEVEEKKVMYTKLGDMTATCVLKCIPLTQPGGPLPTKSPTLTCPMPDWLVELYDHCKFYYEGNCPSPNVIYKKPKGKTYSK